MPLGRQPSPFAGRPAWSRETVSSGSVIPTARRFSWGHLCRFLGVSIAPDCWFTLKCSNFQSSLSVLQPSLSSQLIFHVPSPKGPQCTPKISSKSPSWGDLSISLEPSSLLSLSESVDCSMVILYFIANIHL